MTAEKRKARDCWLMAGALGGMIAVAPLLGLAGARVVRFVRSYDVRRDGFSSNAIGSMYAYAEAQAMFRRNDWDGDGQLEYAADFTALCTQQDGNGDPIQLIDAAFAGAGGCGAPPKHGYVFRDMKTIAGEPIDWKKDFALCAIPAVYGRTGYRTFIVTTDGVVWARDQGPAGAFLDDFPECPGDLGWMAAE